MYCFSFLSPLSCATDHFVLAVIEQLLMEAFLIS